MIFIPVTLGIAGLAWAISGDPVRALAVLVVATPCPLILAAPIAIVAGISRAAKRGIIVKGGGALEALARGRVLLFDKTGTLTTGTPELAEVTAFGDLDPDEVLRLAASLDQVSPHVLATAIVDGGAPPGPRALVPRGRPRGARRRHPRHGRRPERGAREDLLGRAGATAPGAGSRRPSPERDGGFVLRDGLDRRSGRGRPGAGGPDPARHAEGDPVAPPRRHRTRGHGHGRSPRRRRVRRHLDRGRPHPVRARSGGQGRRRAGRGRVRPDDHGRRRRERRAGARRGRRRRRDGRARRDGLLRGGRRRPGRRPARPRRRGDADRAALARDRAPERA